MNPWMNYVNFVPGFQSFNVGANVCTKYGEGKIINIYFKNIQGTFFTYATILVASKGGIVFDQAYNTLVFTNGTGGELGPGSSPSGNL